MKDWTSEFNSRSGKNKWINKLMIKIKCALNYCVLMQQKKRVSFIFLPVDYSVLMQFRLRRMLSINL